MPMMSRGAARPRKGGPDFRWHTAREGGDPFAFTALFRGRALQWTFARSSNASARPSRSTAPAQDLWCRK